MKNELNTLARQREIKCHEKREGRTDLDINFLVFYCSSHTCLFAGFIFMTLQWV